MPDQAGDAYWIRETTVARKMSWSDVVGVPWARSTRMAYIRLVHVDNNVLTWSAAVNLLFTMTPRILRQDTRSMSGRGGGGAWFWSDLNISSLVP